MNTEEKQRLNDVTNIITGFNAGEHALQLPRDFKTMIFVGADSCGEVREIPYASFGTVAVNGFLLSEHYRNGSVACILRLQERSDIYLHYYDRNGNAKITKINADDVVPRDKVLGYGRAGIVKII